MPVVSNIKLQLLGVVIMKFYIRVVCLMCVSFMAAHALAQDLSGWSDKTVCRLVKGDGGAAYVAEASSRGLDCKAPIQAKPTKPKPDSSTANESTFFTDLSIKPVLPHINQNTDEALRQLRESLSYVDGVAQFTLKEGALQNKYDKQTNVNGHIRKASERAELKYNVMADPTSKSVRMSFKFRTDGEIKTQSRILISQIKTLTPSKYQHLSHPNISIYANNVGAPEGNVSCVEWDDQYVKGHKYHMKNIKLLNGFISDRKWHEITLEYIPSIDGIGGLCRITVDNEIQISLTDIQNFPLQVRKDKYLMAIGPYRDKVKDTQIFFYDDWKINIKPIPSK